MTIRRNTFALAAMTALAFAACGDDGDDTNDTAVDSSTATDSAPNDTAAEVTTTVEPDTSVDPDTEPPEDTVEPPTDTIEVDTADTGGFDDVDVEDDTLEDDTTEGDTSVTEVEEDTNTGPVPFVGINSHTAGECVRTRTFEVTGTSANLVGQTVTLSGATGSGVVGVDSHWLAEATVEDDGLIALGASATSVGGATATAAQVAITVDATAPIVGYVSPLGPIDPAVTVDSNSALAGFQTTIVVSLEDEFPTDSEVCIQVASLAKQCRAMNANTTVAFAGVTLQTGENTITVSGDDRCGNLATPVQQIIVLQAVPTFVSFEQVHPIYRGKCSGCHGGATAAGGSGGHNIASATIATAYTASQFSPVHATCASVTTKGACSLIRIHNGSMPAGGGCTGNPVTDAGNNACLTAAQQNLIQRWIDDGQRPPQ